MSTEQQPNPKPVDWNAELADQLDWHWQHHLRPKLDGLTDDEYRWEPVPGSWNVRHRADHGAAPAAETTQHGSGEYVIDYAFPEPTPPPVTTIAWRLGHVIVGVLGLRNASHFGGPPCDYDTFGYAGTAAEALRQLDEAYATWIAGVRGLGPAGLARPCGPAEGPFGEYPMATLVLHINRETIHHGAEILLLRDLYPEPEVKTMAYEFQVTQDSSDPHPLADWWAETLGWQVEPSDEAFIRRMVDAGHASDEDTTTHNGVLVWKAGAAIRHPDGTDRAPRVLFQLAGEGKPGEPGTDGSAPDRRHNRMHLDVRIGDDDREEVVAKLIARGARRLWDGRQGPYTWVTMADPDGNEFCVA